MTGSSRPRLRSEISCGHSQDDLSEGTSARTRPLSYDEIMRRRKSKKQIDVLREGAPETEHANNEECVKNFDHHSRDAGAADMKYSRIHARETDSRKKEETSSKLEDIRNRSKNLESHDIQHKPNYEKDTNGTEAVKTYRRGHGSGRLDEEVRDIDFRSKHKHGVVKNGTEMSKSGREGHASGRVEGKNHDMDTISKDRDDHSVQNRAPVLKADGRGDVQHNMDDKNRNMDIRSKHEHKSYVKIDTRVSKTDERGHRSDKIDEDRHDMNAGYKDRHERIVKNSIPSLKADRRGYVRDKQDWQKHDMDSRYKSKHENDTRNNADDLKDNWQGHVRRAPAEILRDAAKYDNDYKHHRDSTAQNRYTGRNRGVSEIEKKRKDRNIEDEKYRPWDSVKKHDSGRRLGSDISESKEKIEFSHDSGRRLVSDISERKEKIEFLHDSGRRLVFDTSERKEKMEFSHDGGCRLVSDISERKEKTEFSYLRHDESRSKRRRSRSQEPSKDKDRRSKSASPKAWKSTLSRDHEHGPRSSGSLLERSRHRNDVDRNNKASNGVDQSRSKRWRSRSQERSKDKDRRSGSASPKGRKNKDRRSRSASPKARKNKDRRSRSASPKARMNILSREHEHALRSSDSQIERSRHHNDVDRRNTATTGTVSHNRQHNEFSSGLGGYSPRKRKTEAAIKTPSPIRSPERRSVGWDLTSSGVDRTLSASAASGSQAVAQIMSCNKIDLAIGTSVASSMPLSTTFFHGFSTFKDASVDSVQLTQATRPMRRLYIDNIPASTSEKEIMESFNTHLLYSGSNHIRGTRPCISCMIHKEKEQALLEFLTPEDASAALSFDGRSLFGSMLKIRRPKDYVEMTSGSAERLKARADRNNASSDVTTTDIKKDVAISDNVKDSPHKIFVGGIAEGLSSKMIMEIFSVLGPLKAFRFNINKNLNEPCVFLEYADHSVTPKACAALDGMKLGGKLLTVTQAIPDTSFKNIYAFQRNSETRPFYEIPEHAKPLLEKPTLVLKLCNVLDQKTMESLPDSDLEEIMEDIRLECLRFGSVVSINVALTSGMHTTDSKVQVISEELPSQPLEEKVSLDQLPNMDSVQVAIEHDEEKGNGSEPLTNANNLDNVEGDKHMEVEASKMSTIGVKEAQTSASQESNDETANSTPTENTETVNDSDGTNEEPIKGNEVLSITEPNQETGAVKVNDSEASHADVGKQQEVASVPNDSPSSNRGTEISSIGNTFEVGSILVEFKRTEASCMAAHCFHGRLFDDRIVTVEYVQLEAYRARFPK